MQNLKYFYLSHLFLFTLKARFNTGLKCAVKCIGTNCRFIYIHKFCLTATERARNQVSFMCDGCFETGIWKTNTLTNKLHTLVTHLKTRAYGNEYQKITLTKTANKSSIHKVIEEAEKGSFFETIDMIVRLKNVLITHVKEKNFVINDIDIYQTRILNTFINSSHFLSQEYRYVSYCFY